MEWQSVLYWIKGEEHALLRCVPDDECTVEYASAFPNNVVYSSTIGDLRLARLFEQALEKAWQQLETIRFGGLCTHAHGHAIAYLFKKLLDGFGSHFRHLSKFFREALETKTKRVQKLFQPVFETLTTNFIWDKDDIRKEPYYTQELYKKQKIILLRAFWSELETAWNKFSCTSWVDEYKELWKLVFESIKDGEGQDPPELQFV